MTENQRALEAITEQQKTIKEYSPAYYVGEQLKDIVTATPGAAALVLEDLKNKGMGLSDCEKKIEAFASAHRDGKVGCCPPNEAERIIREFYGIPARSNGPTLRRVEPMGKTFSLTDFMED